MIERITKNEERLDSILSSIKNLDNALDNFKSNKNNLRLVNNYYGSKNWFNDKDNYELGNIKPVKAGVLSEDTVWNMNDDINDLLDKMENIIKEFRK